MDQFLTVNVVTPAGLVYEHHAKIVVARTRDLTATRADHRAFGYR